MRPNTPAAVRKAAEPMIFSFPVELNSEEQQRHAKILEILRGNAKSGQHDADAVHVCEAAKHGSYFITHDRRINHTKRMELETALPNLWIVTLAEFLAVFDRSAIAEGFN